MKYPIVYTYKKTHDGGLELKHSIRSLKNLKSWDKKNIFVVGDSEPWFKDIIHISKKRLGTTYVDQEYAMYQVLTDERVPEDFIYFMDDIYITKTTELQYLHWGEIKKRNNGYHDKQKQATKLWLQEHGYSTLDYELHVPMLLNKHKRMEIYKILEPTFKTMILKPRTLYGNIFNVGGFFYEDRKTKTYELPKAPIISTHYYTSELAKLFSEPGNFELLGV